MKFYLTPLRDAYLIEHDMWARYESDGRVTVGITALGVQLAGELYAYTPRVIGTASCKCVLADFGRNIRLCALFLNVIESACRAAANGCDSSRIANLIAVGNVSFVD